jgi:hypothetical protein
MSKLTKALTAAAGNAGESLYVEDVFSTYLYEGNGSTQTITNDIDLDGEGGLVWTKSRTTTSAHGLYDTARGASKEISTSSTVAESTDNGVTSFNSNGYIIGNRHTTNSSGEDYASWTFRKAEKFFDVVTYTGDGVAGRTVAHNLGSVPACIIVKNISLSGYNWQVYHTSTGNTDYLNLNDADATASFIGAWNNTSPTSTHFTLGNWAQTNDAAGSTYVAYLFASDAGGFGDDGSESIIKCGSYTGTGTAGLEVSLGFEPQWLLIKRSDSTSEWALMDNMRGIVSGGTDVVLRANTTNADITAYDYAELTPTGFSLTSDIDVNTSGGTYIYIAIRRPMKTPESGTEVFAMDTAGGTSPTPPTYNSGFPVDFFFNKGTGGTDGYAGSRLQGAEYLTLNSTAAATSSSTYEYDFMDGARSYNWTNSSWYAWMFKRATGFFDVVAYTGNSVSGRTVNHGLKVIPEFIIIKAREASWDWVAYTAPTGAGYYLKPNDTQASAASSGVFPSAPTDSVFSLGSGSFVNSTSAGAYIAYLFASLAGVSKVGSYTGTGADLNVDCGFSAGARFILIKRTDSTGDWYVWDSVRGIVAGNDPYLLLNSTAAEVTSTDYIDPLSSGFTVTSSAPAALNASGGTYIFMAIS